MNLKVVLVEADVGITRQVTAILRSGGYDVLSASDGAEALSKTLVEKPWLLILSEYLPDMAGHHLLQQLNQNLSADHKPRVILLWHPTGRGDGSFWNFPGALTVDMYLGKPFNPVEFESFVNLLREQMVTKGDKNDEL